MKATAREFCGMQPSSNDDSSPACFAMASAYLNGTATALISEAATADDSEESSFYSRASEDYLVTTAQSGDQQAFVELYRRYSASVKKRIFSIVRNQEDAEDALQDTLLRAYLHLGTFRHTCKFSTWITTIGINAALMILRKRKIRKEVQPELVNAEDEAWETAEFADHSLCPEDAHFKHQIYLIVSQEVQKLRPNLRAAIKQYYGSECSLEEAAKTLNITVPAAKSRLIRGRKWLRWSLGERGIFTSGM